MESLSLLLQAPWILGSSAEFVGEFGLWQVTKLVKYGYFHDVEAAIAVCSSHAQIYSQVEPLDNAAGIELARNRRVHAASR